MKKIIVIMFILLSKLSMMSQDRITVALGQNSTFIETYVYYDLSKEYSLKKAYRLGPTSLKVLRDGVNTAIKWAELNESHQKSFTKEICRFKATDKETFNFYKKHIDEFSDEIVMMFYGNIDGTFKLEVKRYNGYGEFIEINDLNMLNGFNDLLNGKSANKEIDDIFKK